MSFLPPAAPTEHRELARTEMEDRLEQLCLDFDEDCVLYVKPPFGSFSKCWDYDRTTGFCPFCLPRE